MGLPAIAAPLVFMSWLVCVEVGAAMVGIVQPKACSHAGSNARTTALSIAYAGQGIGVMLLAPAAQIAISAVGWQSAYQLASDGFIACFILILFLPWRRIAIGANDVAATNRPNI